MSLRPETIAIHAGGGNDPLTGSVTPPIHQTTTFAQHALGGEPPQWCYSRTGNPTRTALEQALAALEGARHGLAFASGLAAANAVLQTLSAGDHVVASQDLYGGCHRLFTKVFARFGVRFSLIDTAAGPEHVRRALTPQTRLLWLETPSNPLLRITDIAACCDEARSHGIRTLVDNTFATPVLQQPLALGADIVLHSTTKYIGGHCDVLGGAVITDDDDLHEQLRFIQNATGGVPGPQDCFLLLRGIRTLPLRVQQHVRSAQAVAEFLYGHREIDRAIYPGLSNHPHHDLARRQASGFGAIVSAEIAGGVSRIAELLPHLTLWPLAESLGGAKSLLCHPATMTHAAVGAEERARIGIRDGLVRFSVGLEHPDDLIDDLDRALHATRVRRAVEVTA